MIYYDILWYIMIYYDILRYIRIYYDILWYIMIYYDILRLYIIVNYCDDDNLIFSLWLWCSFGLGGPYSSKTEAFGGGSPEVFLSESRRRDTLWPRITWPRCHSVIAKKKKLPAMIRKNVEEYPMVSKHRPTKLGPVWVYTKVQHFGKTWENLENLLEFGYLDIPSGK